MTERVQPKVKALFHVVSSDLQTREEGQQRVHPCASGKQRFVDVDVQQQRRLANVLHYGSIVLHSKTKTYIERFYCLVVTTNCSK